MANKKKSLLLRYGKTSGGQEILALKTSIKNKKAVRDIFNLAKGLTDYERAFLRSNLY
jgi:uncharacterized membrane-anchored protein YitT (DUF2179 family)